MGSSNSHLKERSGINGRDRTMMDQPHADGAYPDMNYIFFKGVPKMIQYIFKVTDDIHRMTNYIMDLRNMTIALICLSFLAAVFFFIRYLKTRNVDRKEQLLIVDRLENLVSAKQSLQSNTGTYRSYLDPWHDSTIKTSTVTHGKEHCPPSPLTANSEKTADIRRPANGRTHTNSPPVLKGNVSLNLNTSA
ncbi:unnamed protein product [Thelazia callipaeda]|uniref:Uncharacterized protein n=1 Tax=Thelazia callipaeda TaxID=103827 RepID=A0A0N5CWU1_THECL|nr:unnamed protein product [Thelazia callipaeda]